MTDVPAPDAPATSMAFADAARSIAQAARRMRIASPSFRCPPKVVGVDRAVRRRGSRADQAVVSVRIKGRPWVPVLADMIDGVVVANRLTSPASDRVRAALWEACGYRVAEYDDRRGDASQEDARHQGAHPRSTQRSGRDPRRDPRHDPRHGAPSTRAA